MLTTTTNIPKRIKTFFLRNQESSTSQRREMVGVTGRFTSTMEVKVTWIWSPLLTLSVEVIPTCVIQCQELQNLGAGRRNFVSYASFER